MEQYWRPLVLQLEGSQDALLPDAVQNFALEEAAHCSIR
tara:strand:+ start:1198 stop:1314 length:117 start_codon:yes stop_codon:yes gene_type:complete